MAAQMGLSVIPATITAGTSLSVEVDLGAGLLVGVYVPADWTAANITLQASPDGILFGNMFTYQGAEVVFVAAAGQFVGIDPALLKGARAIKVRSGTSVSPILQVSQANLQLVTSL